MPIYRDLVEQGNLLVAAVERLASSGEPSTGGWNDAIREEIRSWESRVYEYAEDPARVPLESEVAEELMELTNVVCLLQIEVSRLASVAR